MGLQLPCMEFGNGYVYAKLKKNFSAIWKSGLKESLPDELGECSELQILLVNNNQLKTVPSALLTSESLSRLRLEGNKITKKQFLALSGIDIFMKKRNARLERQLAGGMHETDRSVCGLD